MDIIKWRTSYETGISAMDDQHRELIDMINLLYNMLREDRSLDEIEHIVARCVDYGRNHLQEEEDLLNRFDYPDMQEQISSHREFTEKIEQLAGSPEEDRHEKAKTIYHYLRFWWVDHIVAEDIKYGSFLQQKGVS